MFTLSYKLRARYKQLYKHHTTLSALWGEERRAPVGKTVCLSSLFPSLLHWPRFVSDWVFCKRLFNYFQCSAILFAGWKRLCKGFAALKLRSLLGWWSDCGWTAKEMERIVHKVWVLSSNAMLAYINSLCGQTSGLELRSLWNQCKSEVVADNPILVLCW